MRRIAPPPLDLQCKEHCAFGTSKQTFSDTKQVGIRGEETASKYLTALGYQVLDRNLKIGRDEVDILAFDPMQNAMVFAEVKSRARNSHSFPPHLNLTPRKRRAMTRAARTWVGERAYDGSYRLDLLCIAAGRVIDHLRELAWATDP